MLTTVTFLALVCALLAGTFFGVLFTAFLAISPSLALLDYPGYAKVKQCQIKILQVAMPIVSMGYIFLGFFLAYRAAQENIADIGTLTLVGVGLTILALIYSGFTDIPYNQKILKWDANQAPSDWEDLRKKWDFANAVRTIPVFFSFLLQLYVLISL